MPDPNSQQSANINARSLLLEWANQQDHWIRIIASDVLSTRQQASEKTLEEAFATCLSEKGLSEDPLKPVPKLSLDQEPHEEGQTLQLVSLRKVKHVNRLAPDQEIVFNPAMTVLYGENATGKSGYVRILKRVAAVRSAEDVLPDIHASSTPRPPEAELSFTLNGEARAISWAGEAGTRPFTRMSIFDSKAVSFHLDEELTYSYTPRDLSLFQYVNQGIAAIASRLAEAKAQAQAELGSNPFIHRFKSGSVVYPKIETLGPATDVSSLVELAEVPESEEQGLSALQQSVEALNPALVESRLSLARSDSNLLSQIVEMATVVAEFNLDAYAEAQSTLTKATERHLEATEVAFSGDEIPGVLSDAWRQFVAAGDAYRKDLNLTSYPGENDQCLYCRQELSEAAIILLRKYDEFCNDALKIAADTSRHKLDSLTRNFRSLTPDSLLSGVQSKIPADGQAEGEPAYVTANKFISELPPFIETAKRREPIDARSLIASAKKVVELAKATLDQANSSILELQQQSADRQRARAEAEKRLKDLQDRITLKSILPQIERVVANAKWAERAGQLQSKRFPPLKRSLTEQMKVASEDLLNSDFQKLFEQERASLRAPAVRLLFPGRQGEAARRKSLPKNHRLGDVLSEGEQKVIALSDFLAESAIRKGSAPIIFDDPVNSLDYKRIEYIVERLHALSSAHQVIVFTHNIWFASLLLSKFEGAKEAQACSFFSVDLGPSEQPGYISGGTHPRLDTPSKLRGRINDIIQSAEAESGETRIALIESAYSKLRAWCEAVAEQELLFGLSQRYRANIMVGNLRKIRFDRLADASEAVCGVFDKACRVTDAHSHAMETLGTRPGLADLKADWLEAQAALAKYKK